MATVHIALSQVDAQSDGTAMPVLKSAPDLAETLASSATSQPGTLVATKPGNQFWSVTAKGDAWVAFGAAPTAGSGLGYLVLAGTTRDFAVSVAGEKIAIKDA